MTNLLTASNYDVATYPARSIISSVAYAKGLKSVLLYNLAETFDLADEEVIWTSYHLDALTTLLENVAPKNPTLAMKQEAQSKTYTNLLSIRTKAHLPRGNVSHSATTTTPSLSHWLDALAQPVENAYPDMPSSTSLEIRKKLSYILTNLGVGNIKEPRGCTRLPIELKVMLADERVTAE